MVRSQKSEVKRRDFPVRPCKLTTHIANSVSENFAGAKITTNSLALTKSHIHSLGFCCCVLSCHLIFRFMVEKWVLCTVGMGSVLLVSWLISVEKFVYQVLLYEFLSNPMISPSQSFCNFSQRCQIHLTSKWKARATKNWSSFEQKPFKDSRLLFDSTSKKKGSYVSSFFGSFKGLLLAKDYREYFLPETIEELRDAHKRILAKASVVLCAKGEKRRLPVFQITQFLG